MKLDLNVNYSLLLNAQELRLISSALRGTLKDEQRKEAAELQTRIMETKITATKAFIRTIRSTASVYEVEKLEKNMKG